MRKQVKTIFLMLLCSIVFLSGCQAESRQEKEEYGEETEGQEIYCSNIGLLTAELYRKAEEVNLLFCRAFSEGKIDMKTLKQLYADYKMELEEDAMDLLLYLDVIKEFQEKEAGEWKQARYELTDLDGDDIPELFLEKPECWVKIYTFKDGSVSLLLDEDINSKLEGGGSYKQLPGGVRGVKKLPEYKPDQEAEWILAYREAVEEYYNSVNRNTFDGSYYCFIYLDGDDIPELVIGDNVCYWDISIYTMKNGAVFSVVSELGSKYGVDYLPKHGIVKIDGVSGAGAVQSTAYMCMNEQRKLEDWYCLTAEYYDDANTDVMNSEDGNFFYENQEISKEEYDSYVIEDNFEPLLGGKKLYEYFFVLEE